MKGSFASTNTTCTAIVNLSALRSYRNWFKVSSIESIASLRVDMTSIVDLFQVIHLGWAVPLNALLSLNLWNTLEDASGSTAGRFRSMTGTFRPHSFLFLLKLSLLANRLSHVEHWRLPGFSCAVLTCLLYTAAPKKIRSHWSHTNWTCCFFRCRSILCFSVNINRQSGHWIWSIVLMNVNSAAVPEILFLTDVDASTAKKCKIIFASIIAS